MKVEKFKNKLTLMSAGILMATAGGASAQDAPADIGALATKVSGQFAALVKFGLGGAFMVGVFFTIMGIMRLKAAADSQGQQVKYSEGLWRLGVAAALCGIPAIITILSGSTGLSGEGASGLIDTLNTLNPGGE